MMVRIHNKKVRSGTASGVQPKYWTKEQIINPAMFKPNIENFMIFCAIAAWLSVEYFCGNCLVRQYVLKSAIHPISHKFKITWALGGQSLGSLTVLTDIDISPNT